MIASQFPPLDIECLVKTAAELWNNPDADLSDRQKELLDKALLALDAFEDGTAPAPAITRLHEARRRRVWVVNSWNHQGGRLTVWDSEAAALAHLAGYARWFVSRLAEVRGTPAEDLPASDRAAVEAFYGPMRRRLGGECYELLEAEVGQITRTRLLPVDSVFPSAQRCAEANQQAIFLPMDHDPGTLPMLEVAGVAVFTYLDPTSQAVRVSVHLDTTDDDLIRPDGTVPLQITLEDTVVFDDSGQGRHHEPPATAPDLPPAIGQSAETAAIIPQPPLSEAPGAAAAGQAGHPRNTQVWIMRHGDSVTLWPDETTGLAALAAHVRKSWSNITHRDGVPAAPPAEDRRAVDLYFGPDRQRGDETYTLYPEFVGGPAQMP